MKQKQKKRVQSGAKKKVTFTNFSELCFNLYKKIAVLYSLLLYFIVFLDFLPIMYISILQENVLYVYQKWMLHKKKGSCRR